MAANGGTQDGNTPRQQPHAGGAAGASPGGTADTPRLGAGDRFAAFLQGLGLAVLMVSEYWRSRVSHPKNLSSYEDALLRSMLKTTAELSEKDWYRKASDLYDSVSFGQPRAALWAAVAFALVVRLNKDGPAQFQIVLSRVCAGYCGLAAVTGAYYVASGGLFWLALFVGLTVVFGSTRK
ncbi:hypothetical protein [Yinghuangia seranimata]|uniref:hypothetical protein n=1 Tax=Yinghuangia seranimata TaxID=408067 RepID=UPI00248C24AC|nr:hypothetical protein [Yinghuangia seranimata]MDI2128386.1 hypothetical protein [Yinghuangia seranimata]